jgi:phosphonoacetate hydrolase
MPMDRWLVLVLVLIFGAGSSNAQERKVADLLKRQRLVVIMFDGFGMSYYRNAPMPFLKSIERNGFFKEVQAMMPTVTNTNNASICCGLFPERTGITGNSFLDTTGQEEYMERKELLNAPTLFERLGELGIRSALISSKKKTIALLSQGATLALSAETADSTWTARLGEPPGIYSPEVNYWTMRAALDVLRHQPDIRCLYIHTTDYPMHMWAPEDSSSLKHLMGMDALIAQIAQVAPDAMILITADHDMNHKDRCVDIENTLATQGVSVRMAISAERDKYLKHHRGFGGTSYVYLNAKGDEAAVKRALLRIPGVEKVITKAEAVQAYHLMPERIGDLVVLADRTTVFGTLDDEAEEALPAEYRTHGSTYELPVPLLIHNAAGLPPASYFRYNKDLVTWLFGN